MELLWHFKHLLRDCLKPGTSVTSVSLRGKNPGLLLQRALHFGGLSHELPLVSLTMTPDLSCYRLSSERTSVRCVKGLSGAHIKALSKGKPRLIFSFVLDFAAT